MPNISEWPNDAAVCLLSQVLETGSIPQRYYLSAKACAGILRRAEKRGKKLPEALEQALIGTLQATPHPSLSHSYNTGGIGASNQEVFSQRGAGLVQPFPVANTLTARMHKGINTTVDEGQTPVICAYVSPALRAGNSFNNSDPIQESKSLVAFHVNAQPDQMNFSGETAASLTCSQNAGVQMGQTVRRLTPTECERLQGFPDGHTLVPYRNKPAADGPRYKALGNSKAVPVVRWLGERIMREVQQ